MAVGVIAPSPQFISWSRDGARFQARNANQTDATAELFKGTISMSHPVIAKLQLGFDWNGSTDAGSTYGYRVYVASSLETLSTADAIFGGGWGGNAVTSADGGITPTVMLDMFVPRETFLKVEMMGQAGATPRFMYMIGRKVA